jgi:hypothetical protein
VAAILVACDPILLNQQTLVMTETLAAFLSMLALWCLARYSDHHYWWNAGLAGGAIGLAALCRPTFLPWLGLVAGAMVISDFRFQISDWKIPGLRALANVAALAVVAAAVISPWAYRNYKEFGKPILTTTHGGYTLLLGNNDWFYDWLESGPADLPWMPNINPDLTLGGLDLLLAMDRGNLVAIPQGEPAVDRRSYEIAWSVSRRRPSSFVHACLFRIRQLWSPLPHKLTADESTGRMLLRYATAVWYCGVYVMAAVGIWRLRWRLVRAPWVWGVLLCLAFTAVHTLYWCNLRMRAPLMPFVALVAAATFIPTRSASEESASDRNADLAVASD